MNKRNYALKSSGKFIPNFKIEGEKIDNEYFISKFNLPSIRGDGYTVTSPAGKLHLASEIAEFGEIKLNILCDENLNVWKNIFKLFSYMQKFGTSKNSFNDDNYQASFIEVYNQKSKLVLTLALHNCIITDLSDVDYDSSSSDSLSFDVGLKISHLEII